MKNNGMSAIGGSAFGGNKTKKIALLAALPAFALVLSGCGQQSVPTISQTPATGQQEVAKSTESQQKDPVASVAPILPPLPADNRQAIDSELAEIDNELKTTDDLLDSADLSDAQLGL